MNGLKPLESDYSEFVEVDPTRRYGRYNEVLGRGASKTVYRAFDEYEGIEVAWNQVKLNDFLQSPEDLERLYSEIHLLKTLKHKNIMTFYNSWVDPIKRNINFITEMFTSGTLRQYRQKHKRVNLRAVKHWCRQILRGLLYLHSLDPPVIHRDLKCDNIFINGNQGEVKIGDLGLAAILRKSHAAHCVGTPEFMAPEVYREEYNELVDIYSFGMCILEMVTFEYPYSECTHPVQIYKKVISGQKPDSLYKVKDPEVRRFVEKCLATVSLRLPARELLNDPFLLINDYGADLRPLDCSKNLEDKANVQRRPLFLGNNWASSYYNDHYLDESLEIENASGYQSVNTETNGLELFTYIEDEHSPTVDITINGMRKENGEIFLTLRITDKEGRIRNIYFSFDIENDTALSVATEMVAELEMTDQDVITLADMIDGEISFLVPEWQSGLGFEDTPRYSSVDFCRNCSSSHISDGSLMGHLSLNKSSSRSRPCLKQGCASMHGRFEEITFQVEEAEECVIEGAPVLSSQSDGILYNDLHELSSEGSGELDFEGKGQLNQFKPNTKKNVPTPQAPPISPSTSFIADEEYENEIREELRWVKASYQVERKDLKSIRLRGHSRAPSWSPDTIYEAHKTERLLTCSPVTSPVHCESNNKLLLNFGSGKHFSFFLPSIRDCSPKSESQRPMHCEATTESISS